MKAADHSENPAVAKPLDGIEILDMVRGPLAAATRYLAELGATVHRLEERRSGADDLRNLADNIGKRRTAASAQDPEAASLMSRVHCIVADPGRKIDWQAIREARPNVVTMVVSDFGLGNDFSGWRATGPVLHALSGQLSRSGIRGRPPLLPPGDLAFQSAACQAAFELLAALYDALASGKGAHMDFSALEGAVRALDPGFGISGSATLGRPAAQLSRDRPPIGVQYPIFPCADGYVRLCLLSKRQWKGMFRWMGEPAQFAGAEFQKTGVRFKSAPLNAALGEFLAVKTRAAAETEAAAHGVPLSAMLTLGEFVESPHLRYRNATRSVTLASGATVQLPNGVITIDGVRMGPDGREAQGLWEAAPRSGGESPFAALRVLDLGVIVVGAEQARLFGDRGADVVKIESRDYPDGNRQSYLDFGMSASFAAGHRNKRSLGINLKADQGRQLFLELAKKADVILSNFKPGTLESLGLAQDAIAASNPRVVSVESSAFGNSGPWSGRMGYGPLVRAASGLTFEWRYPDDPLGFSDSVTIYPDHVAARVGALAALALLVRRLKTGRGGTAAVAQSEVLLAHFPVEIAGYDQRSAAPKIWPWSVFRARGEDEWCVITVSSDEEWHALRETVGIAKDVGDEAAQDIRCAIESWLEDKDPEEAAALLQGQGVPAARMLRVADLPSHPYYSQRGFFTPARHPYLAESLTLEREARETGATYRRRPAPLAGENTEQVLRDWLGLSDDAVAKLVATSVLEPLDPDTLHAAETHAASLGEAAEHR